ncbi:signal recognition particle-docking protein FtsY [Tepidimicrobium xylanilyticum]|uniref:Signal recognition particle receptor FtsY n=1 Tax=Tepidimicrobium xylanilyticum TaxID=1123352 RepID=A0A1H2YMV3_9FIRM|nr:signal recognition particle-docking protein FtsY [Tepidimicrobium xylanilyticum]SDX06562.1 signal recognition particle-docking protein FtsY [Tepidimicrobium xylanilyticum]
MFKNFFRRNKEEKKDENEKHLEEPIDEEEIKATNENGNIVEEKPQINFFQKLKAGLDKTRKGMTDKIDAILRSYGKIDEELFDDLEEILVTADVGINTTMEIIDRLKNRVKEEKISEPDKVRELLKEEIKKIMEESEGDNKLKIGSSPTVILMVGVNGVGKTTTIGKLSYNFKKQGKKVIIAAGDTFRAAAIEQLEEWSNRSGADFVKHSEGADPAAVIFDGIQAAKARKADVLICDTAGRLHNKKNLMNELSKIFRVVNSEFPEAEKEVLLVLDATTGQNAISQAKVFKEVCDITGVVLTKLDGTAKGGVVIALQSELGLPVKLVGIGEKIDDLQEFNVEDFVEAIFD